MEKYIPILKRTKMFSGLDEREMIPLIDCHGARLRTYRKGEYVLHQGEDISDIFVLVEGKLHIQRDDFWGNRSILEEITIGETFGEAYAPPDSGRLLNDVVAVEDNCRGGDVQFLGYLLVYQSFNHQPQNFLLPV